jgi:hypothetical protein
MPERILTMIHKTSTQFWKNTTICIFLISTINACAPIRYGTALLRSHDDFVLTAPSVLIENQSDSTFAKKIAQALPLLTDSVELKHLCKFILPARIYLCNTNKSFCKYTGAKYPGPRAVAAKAVFISPKLQESTDWHEIIYHELSHIILIQHIGLYRYRKIPQWFTEGLATYISNGGGSGNITNQEAISSILQGQHFIPIDNENFLFPTSFRDNKRDNKISAWMLYRQSMLFVRFLNDYNRPAFKKLLHSIIAGNAFRKSVQDAYNTNIPKLWNDFLQTYRSPSITDNKEP